MNKLIQEQIGLLLQLQSKRIAREGGEEQIEKLASHDRNGEVEDIVEEICRSVIALIEEENQILKKLTE
jgi:hypothetical protein